jgi:hypothetical protein
VRPGATLAAAALLLPAAAAAQTAPRRHVEHAHAWLQLFGEQRVSKRWALYGDAQLRRAEPWGKPQQLLLRPGVLYDAAPNVRLGLGHAYAYTSVYGELPAAAPFAEHRVWEQVQFAARTGVVAWSHRLRAEQRWIEQGDAWRFRQRARIMTRATVDAPALGIPAAPLYLTGHGELFAQIGATSDGQVFDQSRLALQGGWRASPRLRVEAGYMQQLIQRGGSRTTENNHTLLVSVFATGG